MPLQKTRLASKGEEAVRIKPIDGLVSTPHFHNSQGTQTLIWIKSRSGQN